MTLVNIFRLAVAPEDQPLLHEVGVHNLTTSHREEPGTLAMFVGEIKTQPAHYVVFEIYENEDTYAIHRASEQFNNYVTKAGPKLTKRAALQVEPVFLQEKLPSGAWVGPDHYFMKFARVKTTPAGQAAFESSVLTNMKTSLEQEDGVLAMYAVREVADPTAWYFYEVYASPEAYETHRQTAHFRTYIAETQDLVAEKELLELVNDASMTQGKLG